MNILNINSCNFGSTGNIMMDIAEASLGKGYKSITCCPKSRENKRKYVVNQIFIGNRVSRNLHLKLAHLTGYNGCFSILSTLRFLHRIKKLEVDVIHLHNLHNCYINLSILFRYIKKHNIATVWTLHDCWSFTGQCPHFTMVKCGKWLSGCHDCPQYRQYPASYVDRTKTMYRLKKQWFTGVKNMTIVTPSQWLADLVKQSYLKDYPVKVINNGINLDVFKPIPSNFREKYNLQNKHIILGVAFGWGKRKGFDIFIELSKRLSDQYQIVLVGTDDTVDKQLPDNIISIHRTHNQNELAEIYTTADMFANPTREEVLGLVNIESLACGTPVITFNSGGSPECIDETCGIVVEYDNVEVMKEKIEFICMNKPFSENVCISRASEFDMNDKFREYIKLYEFCKKNNNETIL